MATLDNGPGIPGKRLLPRLAIGCLLFAAIMGFGTYYLANLATPYLRKKNEEYLREKHIKVPESAKTTGQP